MFKQIYYSEFKDLNENSNSIEIYKDTSSSVTPTELLLSSDSVIINYEDNDDIFKPLKCSDAQINVLTDSVLTDLYTAKNDVYCIIKRNGNIMWYGYSTACLYQSDYVDTDNLSLQFNDIISTLDTVQYSYFNNNAPVSFYQLIKNIIKRVDKANLIETIYLHKSLKLNNIDDLLNNLYIVERNLFDEEEEAETCKNILENIAKYLNSTITYFGNSIYIIDYSAIDSIKDFVSYNLTDNTTSNVTLSSDIIDINSNIYQTNATISIGENYNKIVVIANTNSSNSALPDMFEDLVNENADTNKYYESTATVDDVDYTILNAFFKANDNYELNRPYSILELKPVDEVTPDTAGYGGSYFQRAAYYETEEEPSSLSWTTYLTSFKGLTDLIIKSKNENFFCGKNGYFIIDLKYKFTDTWNAAGCLKTSDETYTNNKYTTGFTDTMFIAKLHVGDKYFDGDSWVDNSVYENKVNNGYYRNDLQGPAQVEGAKWYKYKDSHGWWVYCDVVDYNQATGDKLSGDCETNKMYYFTAYDNKVFVEESYYRECQLQDGFYLVHKNNEGDKIFDTEYQLTNTVSWRYNLAESEDGVAIKLPENQILYGTLKFELYNPTVLGTYPNYRTDIECKRANAVHISDFKLKYTTSDSVVDIFNLETYESDIKYENIIDEDIVNSLDDIELRINTYNSKAVSYSYVLTYVNSKLDYVENIFNVKNKENLKSEEHYIKKYVEYYSSIKYTYSNYIYNRDITPSSILFENTLNKKFVVSSISYHLSDDYAEITIKEI